jgi:hypothetical protein
MIVSTRDNLSLAKALMRPVVITLLAATTLNSQSAPVDLRDIAERAYIYAYPLVLLEATRGAQPVNQFTHVPQVPAPGHSANRPAQRRYALFDGLARPVSGANPHPRSRFRRMRR